MFVLAELALKRAKSPCSHQLQVTFEDREAVRANEQHRQVNALGSWKFEERECGLVVHPGTKWLGWWLEMGSGSARSLVGKLQPITAKFLRLADCSQ